MTKATDVFTTSEVAQQLGVTSGYLVRVVKEYGFAKGSKMIRKTDGGPYLFTIEGIDALRAVIGGGRK